MGAVDVATEMGLVWCLSVMKEGREGIGSRAAWKRETHRSSSDLAKVLPHWLHQCGRLGSRRASPERRGALVAVLLLEVVMIDGVLGLATPAVDCAVGWPLDGGG